MIRNLWSLKILVDCTLSTKSSTFLARSILNLVYDITINIYTTSCWIIIIVSSIFSKWTHLCIACLRSITKVLLFITASVFYFLSIFKLYLSRVVVRVTSLILSCVISACTAISLLISVIWMISILTWVTCYTSWSYWLTFSGNRIVSNLLKLLIHKLRIFKLVKINFHEIFDEIIHLCFVSLYFININDLFML